MESWVIVLELLFGIGLSIVFFKFTLFDNNVSGESYLSGFIKIFGLLSLLFFFAVFSIGIIASIRFKQSHKIPRAIFYSLIHWVISLVISVMLIEVFYFLSLYIILIGIILGFNKGLREKSVLPRKF